MSEDYKLTDYLTAINWSKKKLMDTDDEAWEKSRKFARDMYIHGEFRGITEGATHYHATYSKPFWSKKLNRIARIGAHIFYWEK